MYRILSKCGDFPCIIVIDIYICFVVTFFKMIHIDAKKEEKKEQGDLDDAREITAI